MSRVVLIKRRDRLHGKAVNQALCLTIGEVKKYRLFISNDDGESETNDDVSACGFDFTSDVGLSTFLIESFWRLDLSRGDIDRAIQDF